MQYRNYQKCKAFISKEQKEPRPIRQQYRQTLTETQVRTGTVRLEYGGVHRGKLSQAKTQGKSYKALMPHHVSMLIVESEKLEDHPTGNSLAKEAGYRHNPRKP